MVESLALLRVLLKVAAVILAEDTVEMVAAAPTVAANLTLVPTATNRVESALRSPLSTFAMDYDGYELLRHHISCHFKHFHHHFLEHVHRTQ
jgi:hypothetical protein